MNTLFTAHRLMYTLCVFMVDNVYITVHMDKVYITRETCTQYTIRFYTLPVTYIHTYICTYRYTPNIIYDAHTYTYTSYMNIIIISYIRVKN